MISDDDFLQQIEWSFGENFKVLRDNAKVENDTEIEIMDENIQENVPYLDGLKRVLKHKQSLLTKKNKTSLDLQSLYEMAKKHAPPLDEDFSNTNLLSKAELAEVKEIIMKQCPSSAHGISRRKFKKKDESINETDSLMSELLRGQ